MTTEEKLKKAIKFIESIKNFDAKDYDEFDLDDLEAECNECESHDINIRYSRNVLLTPTYIDGKVIDDLKDKAWKILFELTD